MDIRLTYPALFPSIVTLKTVNAISVGFFHLVLAGVDLNLRAHSILKRVCILDFLKEISRNLELLSFQKLNGL